MTTCTPDYLHEDLIDCERRGITGEACRTLAPKCHPNRPYWSATPPPHPADFPRCGVRLDATPATTHPR